MSFGVEPPSWQQSVFAVVIVVVTWSLISWRRRASGSCTGTRLPPSLPSLPVVGSLPFMCSDMTAMPRFLVDKAAQLGSVFALYMGSRYTVVLNGHEALREALLKKSQHFAGRSTFFAFSIMNPEHKGISAAPYDEAFRRKHKLYLSILKEFGFGQRLMETRINVEVAEFIQQARLTDGKPFDPKSMVHMCIMNINNSIVLGRRVPFGHSSLLEKLQLFEDFPKVFVPEFELFPSLRFVPPYRARFRAFREAMKATKLLFQREIDVTLWDADHEHGEKIDSFVRRFVESTAEGGPMTSLSGATYDRRELLETVTDLFGAGEDTTASTLLWAFVHLANNPEIQTRLCDEMDCVLGADCQPSLENESKLFYLQAVILETLRLSSIAPLALFHETICDTNIGDYFIPSKTLVIPNLYSAHMDPTVWSEPDEFRPERFLDDHGQITNRENMVAFSLGKRACIGESLARQELFLFLAGIVQNFRILPPDGRHDVRAEGRWAIVIEPSAFSIRLVPRRK